ncbi:hypothetical protein L798_05002 [Zootermopsis nevadensis]|uniref:Uncharacterized protein n=1 Tax=Zootermopsis nevadensis TaxID=136037 RepID=A0A067RAB3_ZOONE|nr:hypothetical protein L798_05002 [Zootermopsis nevadensis]
MQYVIVGQALRPVNLIVFMLWLTDIWSQARMKHLHSQLFRTWFCYATRGRKNQVANRNKVLMEEEPHAMAKTSDCAMWYMPLYSWISNKVVNPQQDNNVCIFLLRQEKH